MNNRRYNNASCRKLLGKLPVRRSNGTQGAEIQGDRPAVIPCTIKYQPHISAHRAYIDINRTLIIRVEHFMNSMVVVKCLSILLLATFAHESVENIKMVVSHLADAMETEAT
jgi:hypothetical protein